MHLATSEGRSAHYIHGPTGWLKNVPSPPRERKYSPSVSRFRHNGKIIYIFGLEGCNNLTSEAQAPLFLELPCDDLDAYWRSIVRVRIVCSWCQRGNSGSRSWQNYVLVLHLLTNRRRRWIVFWVWLTCFPVHLVRFVQRSVVPFSFVQAFVSPGDGNYNAGVVEQVDDFGVPYLPNNRLISVTYIH